MDKRKQEFVDTLKYADRLLKEFDNDLNKVTQQLNKEGKKTLRGCPWQRDNLKKGWLRLQTLRDTSRSVLKGLRKLKKNTKR